MNGTAGGKGGAGGAGATQIDEIAGDTAVKVAVLVRPILDFEKQKGAQDVITLTGNGKVRLPAKPSGAGVADAQGGYGFDFDAAYRVDNDHVSKQVFSSLALRVAERFCQGFNACVLAYGQTGSGKTYTMGTSGPMRDVLGPSTPKSGAPRGIIPRLITSLYGYINAASSKYDIIVKVQYIEIYNENINDLLVKGSGAASSKCEIRETADGEVFVDGATEVEVKSPTDIATLLDAGAAVRAVGAHKMNEQSSRSHAIVTLTMEQRARPGAKGIPPELHFLRSRMNLVDLAGSERQKDTGAEGARFSEGVAINRGLLELGNVINALTEGAKRKHVPYRNSKLTRVLQDSLGGTAETLMLACVSPADVNHEQTLNTLRYAQRARAIKNSLRLNNSQSAEEELAYLRALVTRLQAENAALLSDNSALRARVEALGGGTAV